MAPCQVSWNGQIADGFEDRWGHWIPFWASGLENSMHSASGSLNQRGSAFARSSTFGGVSAPPADVQPAERAQSHRGRWTVGDA